MKKLILVLAIALVASPAMAALDVNLVSIDSDTFEVRYTGADANSASTMPRAFALDLTIDGSGTFDSFVADSYKTGDSVPGDLGYGIYPARIVIDAEGTVTSDGNPLADDTNDPGAGTGFGTNHIVLEFGSLYYGDVNAPPSSGTLCGLNFTEGTATAVTMVDEDTYRKGLVFEDGSLGDVSDSLPFLSPPGPATNPSPADTTSGVTLTTDLSWTAGTDATSHDVYFGPNSLPGTPTNVAMPTVTFDTGTMIQGKTYYCRVVAKNDAGTSANLDWSFNTDCLKSTDGGYSYWAFLGKPNCFCYQRHCRGDGNGKMSLRKPVTATDFTNFVSGYNLKYTSMIGLVDGADVPSVCGDYNHAASLRKPVTATDFTIFQTYYNLKYTQGVPVCDDTHIYFWTN